MNLRQNMIIANGKIITPQIREIYYNRNTYKYDIQFDNGKIYRYNFNSIIWLKDPQVLDPSLYQFEHQGRSLFNISAIYLFVDNYKKYWHICFGDGSERDYTDDQLSVSVSCLHDDTSKNVFSYLYKTARLSELKADDGTNLLLKQYEKMFASKDTALSAYLNPKNFDNRSLSDSAPIFPFGCNASQFKAVKAALDNQISVIQGPPGTGKTQTILNIIANILAAGKTVQVVSNNNAATANVLEKLSSPKYGMGFIVAPLGNTDNKKQFISNQSGEYPDLSSWKDDTINSTMFSSDIRRRSEELRTVFANQERLAVAKQERQELETEYKYFKQYASETDFFTEATISKKVDSALLLQLWHEFQSISEAGKRPSFWLKLKMRFTYGMKDRSFYRSEVDSIITFLQNKFYNKKHDELTSEILSIEKLLENGKAKQLADEFRELSMKYLKNALYKQYGGKQKRKVFVSEDLFKNYKEIQKEYPIVLSTTFSSRSSLCKNAQFDYLIMDEASQVDVTTGALALSCAKNAVIVGDTKQLPNVVPEDIQKRADTLFASYNISESYSYAHKSFLQSLCELLPNIPQTLLREHYRCHPKIINFCNQKFYGGELIIMTKDGGESDVISVVKTAVGDHTRGHLNQRQIDVVNSEVLPNLNCDPAEVGIIAPYRAQVDAIRSALANESIDVATVHKFQGREKNAIVLTTVDDEVTDFTDDPYLLNVAVSRAKKKLCLVVSGNEQPKDSNIGDLISYIEYNNFSIAESKVYSIFDYLYSQYAESRFEFLKKHKKVSTYDSENLMYGLISDTLKEMGLASFSTAIRIPLKMLIRDPKLLNDTECRYAMNGLTHIDFLIYNRISKKPVLAVEVDGYNYHKEGTQQADRDKMKNHILELYEIPYIRFATNGSGEKERLMKKLWETIGKE